MKFRQLLLEAQFHGARRLADKSHSVFWAVSHTIFLVLAACVISATIRRFNDNPTYLSRVSSQHYNLWFPGVLVCPEIKFPDYKIDPFLKEIKLPVGVNESYFRSILPKLAAFFSPDVPHTPEQLEMLQNVLDHNLLTVENVGERLTTSCEETLLRCRWHGYMVNCTQLFRMELTGVGFCCVFNGKSLYREIKEYGLKKMMPKFIYKVEHFGHLSGLMLVLNQSQIHDDVDITYKWVGVLSGQFYVDFPMNGTPISPGSENWFNYHFERHKITSEARSLSDNLRRCKMSYDYFEPLKYFPYYQKEYCIWECSIERTIRRCACLAPTHPPIPGHPRCRAKDMICVKHAKVTFVTDQCNCPRTCDSDIDIVTNQKIQLARSLSIDEMYNGLNYNKVTVVRVFYGNDKSDTFVRNSFFDTVGLFAQIGGEFGVFFGCSVLTLCEILQMIYFLIKNIYLEQKKRKEELLKLKKRVKRNKGRFKEKNKKVKITLQDVHEGKVDIKRL